MINNLQLILPYLHFNEGNYMFMYVYIVQRAKDLENKVGNRNCNKSYFIRSREHLESLMPEIILLCEHYGARAYIDLAVKDFNELQKLMLVKIACSIQQNFILNPEILLNSTVKELKPKKQHYIVNIDDKSIKQQITDWIYYWFLEKYRKGPNTLMPAEYFAERTIKNIIPTEDGLHLITDPFNIEEFKKVFPNINVYSNSIGTLLYYPKSLDRNG